MGIINFSQKLLKKVDRTLSGPLVEFAEQFLYGHREALCAYAGLPDNAIIKGSIEHGWTSFPPIYGIPKFTGGKFLHLLWSSDRLPDNFKSKPNLIAVGAPFIYAHDEVKGLLPNSADLNQEHSERTLFFPGHGTEVNTPHIESQIKEVKKMIDPKKTTVCLFWTEFVNPIFRKKFIESGFKITNAGFSGIQEHVGLGVSAKKHAGGTTGGRHLYLLNLILLLNAHKNVIVGDVGTSAFYSAFMGKNLDLMPEYLDMPMEVSFLNKVVRTRDELGEEQQVRFIEKHMGNEFRKINFSSAKFREFARNQLGTKDFKTKAELHDILIKNTVMVGNPVAIRQYLESVRSFDKLKVSVL
jgi:hypothetical protein